MSEKLQKVLACAGHGSRREIEAKIEAGRVSVDGKIATLGDRVEIVPGLKIRIDGHLISVKESAEQICRVLAYYKPEGELCTRNDPEGRPTVFDRLPKLRGALDCRWSSGREYLRPAAVHHRWRTGQPPDAPEP